MLNWLSLSTLSKNPSINSPITFMSVLGNAVNKELFEQLKQLSKETMIPMSRLLDKGIELVLQEYKKPTK